MILYLINNIEIIQIFSPEYSVPYNSSAGNSQFFSGSILIDKNFTESFLKLLRMLYHKKRLKMKDGTFFTDGLRNMPRAYRCTHVTC